MLDRVIITVVEGDHKSYPSFTRKLVNQGLVARDNSTPR